MNNWAKQIEKDLDWRQAEMASLKVAVLKARPGSKMYDALLRSLWVMLYAHYEGFSKFVWTLYLDAIQRSGCKREGVIQSLGCLSLEKKFSWIKCNASTDDIWQFCKTDFATLLAEPVSFTWRTDDISNLPPPEYSRICKLLGLGHKHALDNSAKLWQLVKGRHQIAHGETLVVASLDAYQPYEKAAFEVMIELALGVIDSLEKGHYKTTRIP